MSLLLLRKQDIDRTENMKIAIHALEKAFKQMEEDHFQIKPRLLVQTSKSNEENLLSVLVASNFSTEKSSVKITTLTPSNQGSQIPSINGIVCLTTNTTGQIVALLEGAALTKLRTGAMCGLATQILANKNAQEVAMIGCGEQAQGALRAVCQIRTIKKIKLWSRTVNTANSFKNWIENQEYIQAEIEIFEEIKSAVLNADIICTTTATDSSNPLVKAKFVKSGAHINAIGGSTETACEFEPTLLKNAVIAVEQVEAAISESGEIQAALESDLILESEIHPIQDFLLGKHPDSQDSLKTTIFRSVGIALQDLIVAEAIYAEAVKKKKGERLSLL